MSEAEQAASETQTKALTVARIYFQSHLSSPEAEAYVKSRGLSHAACRKFEIGYAPENWRGLVDHFKSHSVRLAAKDAGILTSPANSKRLLDFFRGRLIFPIRDVEGQLVGYGGRDTTNGPDTPKYLNTPETDLFQKSQLLYGLYDNLGSIRARREAILVEGYLDVVRLSTEGFPYAAAPMGTALTDEQTSLLLQQGVNKLWICLDGDKAGEKAAERSVDVLMHQYQPTLEIMLVKLPGDHDPDSLIRAEGPAAFQAALDQAVPLPEYIHFICTKGFGEKPCLEDKALYLQRIEPYIENASGHLQDKLIDRAQQFSGLPRKDLFAASVKRGDNDLIDQWHPMVGLAARWMAFDVNPLRIARSLAKLTAQGHGLLELSDMARKIVAGEQPSGLLHQFCKAHGELMPEELDELSAGWGQWHRDAALEHHLGVLSKMPFDQDAREAVRNLTRGPRL